MNKWISIKDRLPEKNNWKVYAVLTNQNDLRQYQIAWFQYSDKTFRLESNPDKSIKVTHWIELPASHDKLNPTKDGLTLEKKDECK